jgi:hypothetical protein
MGILLFLSNFKTDKPTSLIDNLDARTDAQEEIKGQLLTESASWIYSVISVSYFMFSKLYIAHQC